MQKLFDSEIKVMEIIWETEPVSAQRFYKTTKLIT